MKMELKHLHKGELHVWMSEYSHLCQGDRWLLILGMILRSVNLKYDSVIIISWFHCMLSDSFMKSQSPDTFTAFLLNQGPGLLKFSTLYVSLSLLLEAYFFKDPFAVPNMFY